MGQHALGRRHSVFITALQSDHYPDTNHGAGRAMDVGAVDGEICRGARTGACAQLVRELAAMEGRLRSTKLRNSHVPLAAFVKSRVSCPLGRTLLERSRGVVRARRETVPDSGR